jgi:hypothetical protein
VLDGAIARLRGCAAVVIDLVQLPVAEKINEPEFAALRL